MVMFAKNNPPEGVIGAILSAIKKAKGVPVYPEVLEVNALRISEFGWRCLSPLGSWTQCFAPKCNCGGIMVMDGDREMIEMCLLGGKSKIKWHIIGTEETINVLDVPSYCDSHPFTKSP